MESALNTSKYHGIHKPNWNKPTGILKKFIRASRKQLGMGYEKQLYLEISKVLSL